MATGGMGDLLTGIIAGMVAQGLKLSDAAAAGVSLHAAAADRAAQAGERGLLANDLQIELRLLLNTDWHQC
jgi:NAD(P)H-hydrate epimerase